MPAKNNYPILVGQNNSIYPDISRHAFFIAMVSPPPPPLVHTWAIWSFSINNLIVTILKIFENPKKVAAFPPHFYKYEVIHQIHGQFTMQNAGER
jgi:hypothetical protein